MNEELMLKILDNQAIILSMLTKLDKKIDTEIAALRDELRNEFKSDIAALRDELRNEFKSDMAALRNEMHSIKNELQAQITAQQADINIIKFALEGITLEIQKNTESLRSEIKELAAITDEKLDYAFSKIKSLS